MSGLSLDQFKGEVKQRGSVCAVRQLREALDPSDLEAMDAALADRSISASAISRVLTKAGHKLSGQSIGHHRRGDCLCERAEL